MIIPFNFYKPVTISWVTDVHMRVDNTPTELNMKWFAEKVNLISQDLVVDTGDCVENRLGTLENSIEERVKYTQYWSSINSDKIFVPGNRDFAILDSVSGWAENFGYSGRQENAGSKFNHNFKISSADVTVEVISFDYINYNNDDSWLTNVLLNTDADVVMFLSHTSDHFDLVEKILVQTERETLLTYYFHGHNHGAQGMRKYGNKKSSKVNLHQYLLGGLDDRTGFFEQIKIYPLGYMQYKTIERFPNQHNRKSPE